MDTRVHDELPRRARRVRVFFFFFFVSARRRRRAVSHRFRVRESRPLCVLQLLTLTDQRALHLVIVEQHFGQRQRVLRARRARAQPRGSARWKAARSRVPRVSPPRRSPSQQPSDRLLRVRASAGCVRPRRAPRARAATPMHARTLGGRHAIAANCRAALADAIEEWASGTNLATSKPFSFSLSAV